MTVDVLSPELIDGFADALLEGGFTLHTRLLSIGHSLYGALLALTFGWLAVNVAFETLAGDRLGDILAKLLRFVLLAGIVAWLLDAYELVFRDAIYRGSEAVAAAVGGQDGARRGFSTAWHVFVDLILDTWQATRSQLFYSAVSGVVSGNGAAAGTAAWVAMAVLMAVTIVMFVVAMVIYAVIYVMGAALVGVALALGPFFIPWLLWETTNALFFGWVRFMFVACLYKVVAVTLLSMAHPVFERLTELLGTRKIDPAALEPVHTLVAGVGFVVVASILAYLMKSVPQISGALLSGTRVDTGFGRSTGRSVEGAVHGVHMKVSGRGPRGGLPRGGKATHGE